ncbi:MULTISPECIES: creatininase [Helcobacillus]|uniref:Creatinine amidohydrolase n=1 Tax=Helcobacillus massiliensis TaxID=521392 RepID=A0A839QX95_9MICO|nr:MULTISPECIES: creatininase [Helcobacillus]MBB3023459.1 creatinine amidohydrolase [Helcobacillus massiliensis]MCG7427366.1 creatininase [Helcobacillus sp. ACRRO]
MTEQPIDLALFDAVAYREWTEGTSVVLIPVGAFEQHGPHMPLGTDAILSTAMARGTAERINRVAPGAAAVAQPFTHGYKSQQKSGGGDHLPGTISLDASTLIAQTRDIARGFLQQGVSHVVFVNGHYENYQFLYEGIDLALRDLGISEEGGQSAMLLSYWDFVTEDTLRAVYPDGFPGWDIEHGGVLETSLMLHLRPEHVRMERAVSHPPAELPRFDRLPVIASRTPETGCLSAPDGSSAEKGELLFAQAAGLMAEDIAAELRLASA